MVHVLDRALDLISRRDETAGGLRDGEDRRSPPSADRDQAGYFLGDHLRVHLEHDRKLPDGSALVDDCGRLGIIRPNRSVVCCHRHYKPFHNLSRAAQTASSGVLPDPVT